MDLDKEDICNNTMYGKVYLVWKIYLGWKTTIDVDLEMDQGSKIIKMKITSSDSCPTSVLVCKCPCFQKVFPSIDFIKQ